jgi:hypothetical protein
MPQVLNKYHVGFPSGSTYIGRGSKWGNPFVRNVDGTKAEVIAKYIEWFRTQDHLFKAIGELSGRDLICFCAPKSCHGDFLCWLANLSMDERLMWWNGDLCYIQRRCD